MYSKPVESCNRYRKKKLITKVKSRIELVNKNKNKKLPTTVKVE